MKHLEKIEYFVVVAGMVNHLPWSDDQRVHVGGQLYFVEIEYFPEEVIVD